MTTVKTEHVQVSRRAFLAGAGGLTFAIAVGARGLTLTTPAQATAAGRQIGAWVKIAPDDTITILTPGAEMGQGSSTGVPMILAEELDADWSKVTLDWAPADPEVYGYTHGGRKAMAIVGSRAIMLYYDDMRIAGAQVRKALLASAAQKWGVPVAELGTEPSVVVHPASGRRMTYGEIASFATLPDTMPSVAPNELKKRKDFRIVGTKLDRRDIPLKVNGTAQYSIDVQLPGMVYATTRHSPVQMETPKSWNDAKVRAMPGVVDIVKLHYGVAVVADSFEHALAARDALQVTWEKTAKAEGYDSEPMLERDYARIAADPKAKTKTVDSKGDANAAFAAAAKTYRAEFRSDYGYHAQMEPLNAVAHYDAAKGTLDVWEGAQAPGRSRAELAKALKIRPSQVTFHQCYLGGGFGRRSLNDYGIEAALVSRAIDRPVKLIWTREEDVAHAMFRPQSFQCLEAALDANGRVAGWKHCIVGDGNNLLTGGMKIKYYKVPNQHIDLRGTSHGIRLKHWRSVAHVFNVFAIEAFIDEMAAAEGQDPLEFRLQRMNPTPKARRVFEAVARMSDWKASRPEGRALGLSITERSGSLGAGVVEISFDRAKNKIRVHKVWIAVDGGVVVQPEGARNNIESGIMYGLSSVLKERATVKGGAVEQSNFHDYEVLRMSDAPEELHVEFLDRNTKPTGLGEIGNPFIAAAVANAFHVLTGKRLRHMPFTPERIAAALKA